jgi:hypothetical protein
MYIDLLAVWISTRVGPFYIEFAVAIIERTVTCMGPALFTTHAGKDGGVACKTSLSRPLATIVFCIVSSQDSQGCVYVLIDASPRKSFPHVS